MAEGPKDWDAKADFMRRHNATMASWNPETGQLQALSLGPALAKKPETTDTKPTGPKGVAARLMKQHEIQFAHSRFRPPLNLPPTAESDVPRAVSAKRDVARGSSKKAQKRAS